MSGPAAGSCALRALVVVVTVLCAIPRVSRAQHDAGAAVSVDGRVALGALISLGDAHLRSIVDSLRVLAATEAARSGDWEQIKTPLGEVATGDTPALAWFALPDGSYWSVQEGRAAADLAGRPYFSRALAGQTVIGDLVVSKATGKNVAIVAVPVVRKDRSVGGVLGASVYLDKLSEQIKREMDVGPALIFYSFDAQPLLGLVWDEGLIFAKPKDLGEEVDRAFTEMLTKGEGTITYSFRGKRRTVLYRKSGVTGWTYGFGVVD